MKQTKKQLLFEILRFLLVGGLATLIDYLVANLFYAWLLPPSLIGQVLSLALSTALGFGVGLVLNWALSVLFVFRAVKDEKKARSGKSFGIFTLIGLVGLGISVLGMQFVPILPNFSLFGTELFLGAEWKWWLMKAVMTCTVLVWNYIGRKIFIFRS